MATYLLIRDGKVQLRLQNASIVAGKLTAPTSKGRGYVVDAKLAELDGQLEEVKRTIKEEGYGAVDRKYLAGPGISASGLLVIEETEWRAQQDAKAAERLWGRQLAFARDGRPVIVHDVREDLGTELEFRGCRWTVTGVGSGFERGRVHQVRYAYVQFAEIVNHAAAYETLSRLQFEEQERYRRQFDRMMEDGDNDGVSPPRPVSKLLDEILALVSPDVAARIELGRRVRAQADSDPSTTLGYLRGEAGRRALELFRARASVSDVEAALESYQDDPRYVDAAWG